ncbi:hypothetical protein ACFX2C_020075 [Malus domestica]
MVSPQVLALPDFSKEFTIESDASNTGIGAVLHQGGKPIAFTSKALGPKAQAMSTYEREMLAIVHAIKKWQSYIQGRHFIIKTDHHNLKFFLQNRTHTPFQHKWISKLLGFDYEIQYKQGCDNIVADALSHMNCDVELSAISYPYLGWLDDIRRHGEHDPWIIAKVRDLSLSPDGASTSTTKYHFDNGFLKYNGRIVLSPSSCWREKIFYEHHCTLVAGHSDFLKTYKRISRSFYWQGMKSDVMQWVAACQFCQQNKTETLASPGLLNPLPIPSIV